MKYIKLTERKTGNPIWIREDQIASWKCEGDYTSVSPIFDSIDMEVRETGERILDLISNHGAAPSKTNDCSRGSFRRRMNGTPTK